jgi:hypothetical protein
MPLAVERVDGGTTDRPVFGGGKVLDFDYGEPQPHAPPTDPVTLGKVAMPPATEGRKLKRQRVEGAPTMERLEGYVMSVVPNPNDPAFEEKMAEAVGKTYGVGDAGGKGQTSTTASVAGTTIGSIRRTVDQMLKMSAGATATPVAAKATQATGGAAKAPKNAVFDDKPVTYRDAICADVPQNLEIVTCELVSRLGLDDDEGWTIPAMTPVFHNPFANGSYCNPPVYGHFRGFFHGEFAGVALHDGLEAHQLLKEHQSRRSLALAVGGIVNLSCDRETANKFELGHDVYICEGSWATLDRKRKQCVPRYYDGAISGRRCLRLGRFVDRISKKHGGIRIVLDPGKWEIDPDAGYYEQATSLNSASACSTSNDEPYCGADNGYARTVQSLEGIYTAGTRADTLPLADIKSIYAGSPILARLDEAELTAAENPQSTAAKAAAAKAESTLRRAVKIVFDAFDQYAREKRKLDDLTIAEKYIMAKKVRLALGA